MYGEINKRKLRPVWVGGLFFGAVSLVLNLLMIGILDMVHVYDIVHIFPVAGMLSLMPAEPEGHVLLLLMAVLVDVLVGLLAGLIVGKLARDRGVFWASLSITFAVYFIVVCYQWIPIL